MKIRYFLLLVLSATIVVACTNIESMHGKSIARFHPIVLLVTGNEDGAELKVNTGPMKGCINSKNGCMVFQKNEHAWITFALSGNDGGFHITQLKICMGAAAPGPIDVDCPLPSENSMDFFVLDSDGFKGNPSTSTGKIEWSYADNVKTFQLIDLNKVEQQYYYLVIACDASSNCPLADPPLDNKGMN
jgi:hypothetical protein